METYVLKGEEQQGPYSNEEIVRMAEEGTLLPDDLAWQEGMEDWRPLVEVPAIGPPRQADEPDEIEEAEPEEELATEKQKALLDVYEIPYQEPITKELALALLHQRDLRKPIPAASWNEFKQRFPPVTKRLTHAERTDALLNEILAEHDTSYWMPDYDVASELLQYLDHRFKGWEHRVNSYDLVDRGINAFFPPPYKQKIEGTTSEKSVVLHQRKKRERKEIFLEGTGLVFVAGGVILLLLYARRMIDVFKEGTFQDVTAVGAVAGGLAAIAIGIKCIAASRTPS